VHRNILYSIVELDFQLITHLIVALDEFENGLIIASVYWKRSCSVFRIEIDVTEYNMYVQYMGARGSVVG
jgi:hypothetical protein